MQELAMWAEGYIRHRDSVQKKLVSLQHTKGSILAEYKDRKTSYLVLPQLDESALTAEGFVVCENTKKNLRFLLSNWKEAAKNPSLTFLFVNPNSALDTKWLIKPYVHERISDEKSLKLGLQAMFETVEETKA